MANVVEAAVPTFESRAPWLSISKVKPRFAYRCLSLSLALANKPPCGYSFLLPFSFCSLPHLATFHNAPTNQDARLRRRKYHFRAAEISVNRFLFRSLTTSLMNVNVREYEFCDSGATAMYGRATTALSGYRQL